MVREHRGIRGIEKDDGLTKARAANCRNMYRKVPSKREHTELKNLSGRPIEDWVEQ